jgi:hypothetical protein
MNNLKTTNLCTTCENMPECCEVGILERETCTDYEPRPLDDLVEADKFVNEVMAGSCPKCGSDNTSDCENDPILKDNTIGHCQDCGAYWCLECGHIFKRAKKGMECPHFQICAECSEENGYLKDDEFMEKICSSCENCNDGCQLEDPSECEKAEQSQCPYGCDVSECTEIQGWLQK